MYPLVDHPAAWVTLVLPAFGVSTAEAYAWWDAAGQDRGGPEPAPELRNDLQGPVVAHHPEIARIVGALQKAGAFHAAKARAPPERSREPP